MDKNITILIIEDEIIASEYLCSILDDLDFENIHTASSAKEAMQIIYTNNIDLIFMDINISGNIDGIQCASKIKENYDIPIIYTSAYADSQTIKEASLTNLYGYLVKPFKVHELEATLQVALTMIKKFQKINSNEKEEEKDILYINEHLKYNFSNKTLYENENIISLTKRESLIVDLLCKSKNSTISYETLKYHVWKNDKIADSTIRDAISRLKRKTKHLRIENISSLGYELKV